MHAADAAMRVAMHETLAGSAGQKVLGPGEPDSGSIGGGIDRAQRIASQLSVIADHASALSDRLTGNGQTGEKGSNASAAPQSPGHVDALHLSLSRQEMIVQRLRTALEEIERRIG